MRRLRVLHLITRLVRGGARRVVEALLRGLPADRFDQVVAGGLEDCDPREAERSLGRPVRWLRAMSREILPARAPWEVLEVAGLVARLRPDVLHAHTYKAGIVGSMVGRALGVPRVIFSPHGHIFAPAARIPGVPRTPWVRAVLAALARSAARSAHVVIALSPSDRDDQVRLRLVPPAKCRVITNGIEPAGGVPAPVLNGRGPVLGTLGRLTEEKGHRWLLDAFAEFRRRHPGAVLAIGGEGPEEPALRSGSRQRGIEEAVRFEGFVGDVNAFLARIDVYVQPSYYEGLGLSVVEAMAAARPVVATRVGGLLDVVEEGLTGHLVEPDDVAGLAAALERIVAEPERARAMGRRGRERALAEFGVDRMVRAYAEVYAFTPGVAPPGPPAGGSFGGAGSAMHRSRSPALFADDPCSSS